MPALSSVRFSGLCRGVTRLALVAIATLAPSAKAYWITESIELRAGWNAVWLHVDPSYNPLDQWIGLDGSHPVQEIWLWQPDVATLQFVTDPQQPINGGSQWVAWKRSEVEAQTNPLKRMIGSQAYLIRSASAFTWEIKGKATPPRYRWSSSGQNFVGFATNPDAPPDFETFLSAAPDLFSAAQIFDYNDQALGENNPRRLFGFRGRPVNRSEAFWIRTGNYFNRYFGPFELSLPADNGLFFEDSLGRIRLRLRNQINSVMTVTVDLVDSEAAPEGQTAIAGNVPLLVRGELNTETLTYGSSDFTGGAKTYELQPAGQVGSEVEIVIGVDRSLLTGDAGTLFAGILRFTDNAGVDNAAMTQFNVPVSATVASSAGLWIGEAQVSQVKHDLKTYARDTSGGTIFDENGNPVLESENLTNGSVPRSFPLRLILHNSDDGNVKLLQRVYFGLNENGNSILSSVQGNLEARYLESARRISAVHLPWTEDNDPWNVTGDLALGQTLTASILTGYDSHASNPFIHTYHPNHDNLNAQFDQILPVGSESYGITRAITLTVTAPPTDFDSRTQGAQTLSGTYEETVTFQGTADESKTYETRGAFAVSRINEIGDLLTAP